jgi:hypothetical protein
MGGQIAMFAFVGAYPWAMRTMLFMIWTFNPRTVRRGLAAAALSCLIAVPVLAIDAGQSVPTATTAGSVLNTLFGRHPYLIFIVLATIWLFPRTGIWRRLDRRVAPRSHAMSLVDPPAVSTVNVGSLPTSGPA